MVMVDTVSDDLSSALLRPPLRGEGASYPPHLPRIWPPSLKGRGLGG
jgi:hypothetical protein